MIDQKTARSRVAALLLYATLIVLFVMSVTPVALFAEDQIAVKRDKDKTVYSIGPSGQNGQEEGLEGANAWGTLKHRGTKKGKRKGQPSQSRPVSPFQGQPVPPTQDK